MSHRQVAGSRRRRLARTACVAGGLAVAACTRQGDAPRFPGDTTGIVRPRALHDLESVVRQLNAIVLADMRDMSTMYDRCEGPRTVLQLANVRTLLGGPHTDTMQLRVFGGPIPGGRYARDSEAPRYAVGRRYLLFLFNTDWRFSPVIGDLAFRVERVAGREVLVSPDGQGVTGVTPLAVETRTPMLFLPEGRPGVGSVRVAPTPAARFVPCRVAADGTPQCPSLPADSEPPREILPPAEPSTPRAPTAEDVARTIGSAELVRKIDSVATALGVTPGGYFARRPRLECWNVVPTARPRP